jgi:hypothetical protein
VTAISRPKAEGDITLQADVPAGAAPVRIKGARIRREDFSTGRVTTSGLRTAEILLDPPDTSCRPLALGDDARS